MTLKHDIDAAGYDPSDDYLTDVAAFMQERIDFARDLAGEQGAFFFEDPDEYEEEGVEKRWKDDFADLMEEYADRLEAADRFDTETIEEVLPTLAEERDAGAGRLIHPSRLAVSGRSYGPGVFSMMAVLGQERCLRRMRRAAEVLG